MGRIPHEQRYRVAAENDDLLMTSRREPFGMVTIEAMAMGCVPLAYEIESGTREIIEHGESGFLLPLGSAKAWARALTLLHQDRTRLKAMGLAAAARARMAFSADQAAAKWNTLLGSLKGGSSSSVERRCGQPLLAPGATHIGAYHKLPSLFRRHVRIMIAPHPRLSRWVLSRWS
jgi:hypothetical protein